MDLDKAIQSRKSVRKFSSKKPDWRDIVECIDAARYAPMAGNNFTLKFIVIDNPEKIEKLGVCCQQDFVKTAHYVVIVCSNPTRTINAFEESGKGYCKQQAGAAIQNFLLKIQEKGLATCWVGHFVEAQVKREFTIPATVQVEAILPIGYEVGKSKRSLKTDIDNILYFHKYKNKHMKPAKKIDV